ncbi:ABC transporter substrate-binding protein [Marinomonas posidonica]|uniref:ABC-type transporter, periplasmic subunit n=1 Tax=Marinomonas posidonica (strain CECT 7376 / NCIMB 14433 / IVIA-Po-181) TaxID=491952 RepID=F6D064_MARPP|nr:ABC transporter substrate-binding protein [Marinomonas posidonica]AEF55888.1 ABC-type transporter, periplasmic subunit [Marinomonas posidonica IVIA-Po-181]
MIVHSIKRLGLTTLLLCLSSWTLNAEPQRLVSIDWSHTETLLGLGVTPVGATQKTAYNAWVKEPSIPIESVDIGLRTQPNLERLAELNPDHIFVSPAYQYHQARLEKIAPVTAISIYAEGKANWQALQDFTHTMASAIGKEDAAQQLIAASENSFQQLKASLPVKPQADLLMIQFMDARHVRVFGHNSMYQIALNQLGIKNAWSGDTNAWGFALVGIDSLLDIKGQFVVVDPLPAGAKEHLEQDQLWQYLIKKSGHPVLRIEPVWSFGAIPSTVRFATLITHAIQEQEVN